MTFTPAGGPSVTGTNRHEGTINHDLAMWKHGAAPGADGSGEDRNTNIDKIDTLLIGTGNSLPTRYKVGGIFLLITDGTFYHNTGEIEAPVWEAINGGSGSQSFTGELITKWNAFLAYLDGSSDMGPEDHVANFGITL